MSVQKSCPYCGRFSESILITRRCPWCERKFSRLGLQISLEARVAAVYFVILAGLIGLIAWVMYPG